MPDNLSLRVMYADEFRFKTEINSNFNSMLGDVKFCRGSSNFLDEPVLVSWLWLLRDHWVVFIRDVSNDSLVTFFPHCTITLPRKSKEPPTAAQ